MPFSLQQTLTKDHKNMLLIWCSYYIFTQIFTWIQFHHHLHHHHQHHRHHIAVFFQNKLNYYKKNKHAQKHYSLNNNNKICFCTARVFYKKKNKAVAKKTTKSKSTQKKTRKLSAMRQSLVKNKNSQQFMSAPHNVCCIKLKQNLKIGSDNQNCLQKHL